MLRVWVTKDVPARTMVVGIPAQAKRELSDEAVAEQRQHARRYAEPPLATLRRPLIAAKSISFIVQSPGFGDGP